MGEPPVTPGRDEAHDWLWTELQQPEYAERQSLLQRLMQAFQEWLASLEGPGGSLSAVGFAIAIVVVAVIVIVIARVVAGPVRREKRTGRGAVVVEKDDVRTAQRMRAAADAAANAGDWSLAVVERFRAVVRSCEERVVIETRPGRTAQEAARDIGAALPALAGRLHLGAGLFDQVEYGGMATTASDDDAMRRLDGQIGEARVERTEVRA